jgi:parallel beta-helix repeat protein
MLQLRLILHAVVAAVISTGLAVATAAAAEPTSATWVVDRDRAQCANADFTSIQAAVDAAQPGDLIRVCPDVYPESVVVDKPLTLNGDSNAVETIDCFAPTLGELPGDQQVIVDPADAGFSIAFKLEADDIILEGFVVQGASVGVDASDRFSGYRVHHNLLRLNTLFAVDFGSEGTRKSRVDHNCLRQNQDGLVSELDDDSLWKPSDGPERDEWNARDLANARIDHNSTFRNLNALYVVGPGRRDLVTFDHNISQNDGVEQAPAGGAGIALQNSTRSAIVDNEITSAVRTFSILLGRGNDGLEVRSNTVRGGLTSIRFARPSFFTDFFPVTSHDVVVTANDLRGGTTGIDANENSLVDSLLAENTTSGSSGNGIILLTGDTGNTVRDNQADNNELAGITALAGATGNRFERNSMHGNSTRPGPLPGADARDFNTPFPQNVWLSNDCDTDIPAGMICGVG